MSRLAAARLVLGLAISLSGLAPSRSGLADVAAYRFTDYFLYARQESDVMRWACDGGRQIYDRATCALEPTRIPATKLYEALARRFAAGTASAEIVLADLHARLDQTELRMLELLNSANGPVDSSLKPAMEAALARLLDAAPELQERRDQVARLEAAWASQPSADLGAQLVTARREFGETAARLSALGAEASAARKAYVEANSSLLDPSMYRGLIQQRSEIVARIENARYGLSRETDRAAATERTIAMIEDGGPTWVQSRDHPSAFGNGEILAALHGTTDEIDREERSFKVAGPAGASSLRVEVTRPEPLEQFFCKFVQRGPSDCQVLRVTTPSGVAIRTTNWFTHRWSDAGADPRVFAADPRGVWTFDILWECAAVQGVEGEPECFLEVASAAGMSGRR